MHFLHFLPKGNNAWCSWRGLNWNYGAETMVKICFCLNICTRLQGIIQNKSASGSQMLPPCNIWQKKVPLLSKNCVILRYFLVSTLKVPFLKDSGCFPKILDYTLDLHWHAPQTQINLHDFLLWRFFLNWDSLPARLNSHCKAWSYKKKKPKKIKAYRKSI